MAVASRGRGGAEGEPAPAAPAVFWDYLFSLSLGVGLLGAVAAAWLLMTARGGRKPERTRSSGLYVFVFVLAVLAGIAIAVRLADVRPDALRPRETGSAGTPAPGATTTADASERREPQFRWLPLLVLGGLAAATVAGMYAYDRSQRRRRAPATSEDELVDELASLLDDTLDDLRAEPDPRRAVIAAYARMERALAAHGLPRRSFEAPIEYLDRVAGELHERLPSVRRLAFELTHLFERAKFSHHEVDAEMKGEAITTLAALRDELREAAA